MAPGLKPCFQSPLGKRQTIGVIGGGPEERFTHDLCIDIKLNLAGLVVDPARSADLLGGKNRWLQRLRAACSGEQIIDADSGFDLRRQYLLTQRLLRVGIGGSDLGTAHRVFRKRATGDKQADQNAKQRHTHLGNVLHGPRSPSRRYN